MSPTVYLVSGANRGIGLGLVTQLASRNNVIVFAGARNPSVARDLQVLVQKHPGKLHILQVVSGDKAGNEAAASDIKRIAGKLDVVIANAGISNYNGPALETPLDQMRDHYEVNVIGTLALFQATYSLLSASPKPKFIVVSSMGGSITTGALFPFGLSAYGASKAAVNYLARKIHVECPNLICFPLHPGAVVTDMMTNALDIHAGLPPTMPDLITVEESATKILVQVDEATRESASGEFINYTGEKLEW